MSELNKEELRRLAEACVAAMDQQLKSDSDDAYQAWAALDDRFNGVARPESILALLDELDNCARYWGLMRAENEQLRAEVEALRRDAGRYRFLRNQHWPVAELAVVCRPKVSVKLGHDCPSGARLDEQVDGAMKQAASHD